MHFFIYNIQYNIKSAGIRSVFGQHYNNSSKYVLAENTLHFAFKAQLWLPNEVTPVYIFPVCILFCFFFFLDIELPF